MSRRAPREAVPGPHPGCPAPERATCPRTPALLLSYTLHLRRVGLQVTAFTCVTSSHWLPRITRPWLLGPPSEVGLWPLWPSQLSHLQDVTESLGLCYLLTVVGRGIGHLCPLRSTEMASSLLPTGPGALTIGQGEEGGSGGWGTCFTDRY